MIAPFLFPPVMPMMVREPITWPGKWEDLRFTAHVDPATSKPDYSSTYFGYEMRDAQSDTLCYAVQFPHAWAYGGEIRPHVHVQVPDNNAGNVVWRATYKWANANAVFPSDTVVPVTKAIAASSLGKHLVHSLTAIDGTGFNPSSMLLFCLSRLGTDVADTYAASVYVMEFDIHYQVGRHGTAVEFGPD